MLEQLDCAHHAGGLVHPRSAPEDGLFRAAGLRHEIQANIGERDVDWEYLGHCLRLLQRCGDWQLLRDACGAPFSSFLDFCYAAKPHGLGLLPSELESLRIEME